MSDLNRFLEELRQRIRVSDIVKKSVTLKSKNGNEYSGLCPFHKEKSASFTVNDQKGFYHCFGCGAHGDIVRFITESRGLEFIEAVNELAAIAGMKVPGFKKKDDAKEREKLSLYQIMDLACNWFSEQLYLNSGSTALSYLINRGLNKSQIELFRIGFSPNDAKKFLQFFATKDVKPEELIRAGLLIKSTKNDDLYPRFRNRVMFPIADSKGRVVAFGGRILEDGQPKYLNSPESEIFKKGEILYNEHLIRDKAFRTQKLIVSEGYMDVIALHLAGVNAVAPLGTAITSNHLQRLWRIVKEPIVCLDGDFAGQNAMARVARLALGSIASGFSLNFAILPKGMDPDDIIKKNGITAIETIIGQAQPLFEILYTSEYNKSPVNTPESLADLETRLNELVNLINDKTVKNYYFKFFSNKLWQLGTKKSRTTGSAVSKNSMIGSYLNDIKSVDTTTIDGCQNLLMAAIISFPEILNDPDIHQEFLTLDFTSLMLDKLYASILDITSVNSEIDKKCLYAHLATEGLSEEIEQYKKLASLFFASSSSGLDKVIKGWHYIYKLYNLAVLRKEYINVTNLMTEASEAKALEYRSQIANLERQLLQMQQEFDA